MPFTDQEILETVRMIELETLDIRTTTLGISLFDCADPDLESCCEKIYTKIVHHARDLVATAETIAGEYGVPIVNKRIAVTPVAWDFVKVSNCSPSICRPFTDATNFSLLISTVRVRWAAFCVSFTSP